MKNYLTRLVFLFVFVATFGINALCQPAAVPKTNPTKVYMHYMPWFDGPQNPVAGGTYSWGWHWTMNNKNPNIIDANGKRQIASHYYPIIGPYASNDPHVVEYHLLLMKLSGIDGVLIDWYGSEGSNGDVGNLLNNSNALINRTGAVGINFGLVLEDRFWSTIQNGRNSMTYAKNNYFNKSNFIRSNGAPLVGVFGPVTYQTPSQWTDILSYAGQDIEFLPLWYENGDAGSNADGEYAWIYSDYLTGLRNFYGNRAPGLKTAMGVAYPGFHDYYVEGGAGSSYFYIPENNGTTLNETLSTYDQYKGNLDFLQLATFNDFGEGTVFEPTQENGFKYLARIQQYTGVPYTENDLKNVQRLFTLRKKYLNDATKQSQLNTAFDYFVALRLNDAVAMMNTVDGNTPPPPPTTTSLPGTLQAESYSAMNGIQTETTSDTGGGQNVGWIDANDWMDYSVNVSTAGSYNVSFRVASGTSGGQMQLRNSSGNVLATVTITGTGGWQTWTNVTTTASLSAGAQTLRLYAVSGGYNVNYVQFTTATTPPPPTTIAIPGTLQAESYSAMNGIQTETTSDAGGGQNVGWIDANDWMDYSVNVSTAGSYTLGFRVASAGSGGQMQLRNSSGTVLATATIAGTGGWQTWTTVNVTASLAAGAQTLRLFAVSGGYNINYVQFSTTSTPPPPPTGTSYYIKNRWQNTYLFDGGDRVKYAATKSGSTYQWVLEDVGSGLVELRNVGTGEYMHVENLMGYVQCTTRTSGWASSRWASEATGDGYVRLRNAWQSTSYIHVENLQGHAQYGAINTAWASAQWLLEVVPAGGRMEMEEQQTSSESVRIWPTVVDDELFVRMDGSCHSLIIVDMLGRIQHREEALEGKDAIKIDVSHLQHGLHLVKLQSNTNGKVFRIQKK
jgi:hypothetical protein